MLNVGLAKHAVGHGRQSREYVDSDVFLLRDVGDGEVLKFSI